jgi:RNA polymerase-interacting CarD/CdnL/TRCF family regulator
LHFSVGNMIVHPTYGIGKVVGIEDLQYQGQESRPFYKISLDNGVIWVQVDDAGEARLRPLTPADELDSYREVLTSAPNPLSDDRYKRYSECNARLKSPSFRVWCELVRDLTAHGATKRLNEYDSSTLRKVSDIVAREWALSAGIPLVDAAKVIKNILSESQSNRLADQAG